MNEANRRGADRRVWRFGVCSLGIALAAGTAMWTAGCTDIAYDAGRKALACTSQSKPFEEWVGDPVALATVRTIAVLPLENTSAEKGFEAVAFATRFANQLASTGAVRVIYPRQALEAVERQNQAIRRHNAEVYHRRLLGAKPAAERAALLQRAQAEGRESIAAEEDRPRELMDPVRNLEDAVTIGRILKADAVIMGTVLDYDPYLRPRISLSLRLVATGASDAAAQALAELTQWGIPRSLTTARGVVWFRQQNFDSRDGNIGSDVYFDAISRHIDNHPYDAEAYLRSPSMYADFVGAALAKALLKARDNAVAEAERRALAEARRLQASQETVRNRLRSLCGPDAPLPDADGAIAANLPDRRDRGWRPDVYNNSRADKAAKLYTPEQRRDLMPPEMAPNASYDGKPAKNEKPQPQSPSSQTNSPVEGPTEGIIGPGMTGF